jgi:hypothetical protein
MDCRGSLISAHLLMPELDPDEIRQGRLWTLLIAVSVMLLSQLSILLFTALA